MRRFITTFLMLSLLLTLVTVAEAQNYYGNQPAVPAAQYGSSQGTIHIVVRGETLLRIALRYGTTVQAIATANNIYNVNRIYAGQRLIIPAPVTPDPRPPLQGTTIYIVGRGDYLAAIAQRFSTTVSAIASANGISNPNLIYPGQQLRIPIG
jgi:LysM repeat protein